MNEVGLRRGVVGLVLAGVVALAGAAQAEDAAPRQERPKTSTSVTTRVDGGGGLEPVLSSPPPLTPPTGPTLMVTRIDPPTAVPGKSVATGFEGVRVVSMKEGEATLDVDGARQTVQTGGRLLQATVKAVAPDRLVIERPMTGPKAQGTELVIVTFDETGRARTRVFWSVDPTAPVAPEVKRP